MTAKPGRGVAARLARVDWARVSGELDAQGFSWVPGVLTAGACRLLQRTYDVDDRFRSTVDMERHRFGRGQYRYFAYPLPSPVEELRQGFYTRLQGVANAWQRQLGAAATFPAQLDDFLAQCRRVGQGRPTALILRYQPGDYNRLHQDLYGAVAFPLQVVINLSRPGRDYVGGELVLVEQKPRTQSRATVLTPGLGDAVIFTNRDRPVSGSRGIYRVQMRHGASTVARGRRFALGLIFHDAE